MLVAIKNEFIRIAEDLSVLPVELSKHQFLSNSSITEWTLKKFGNFGAVKNLLFGENLNPYEAEISTNAIIQGVRYEKQRLSRLHREIGRNEYVTNSISQAIGQALRDIEFSVRPSKKIKERRKSYERTNVVHISDTHFGLKIDPYEVESNQYSWTIAARRLGKVAFDAAHFKQDHRNECKELVINLGGDLCQGIIHLDDDNQDMLTYQIVGAARMLIDFIDYQRDFYERIRVAVTPDNHMRISTAVKGKDRATAQKFDSYNTIMVEIVQQAFRFCPEIEFLVPKTPYTEYQIFGVTHWLTHGDTVLNVGYLSSKINTEAVKNAIMSLNATRDDRIGVVWCGHIHVGVYMSLDIDVDLFVNPSLSGSDPYATSHGFFGGSKDRKSRTGQWLVECTKEERIGDSRIIWAQKADDEPEYEEIIRPFDYSLAATKALGI